MDEITAFIDTLSSSLPLEDGELYLRIFFQVLLLASSAVFSGSETALFSLSRIDLQKLRHSRHKNSESIHEMLDEPRRLIISILCGNELVNIASAVNMTGILLLLFGQEDIGWINVVIMVPLLLLIGEVTPKTIAVSHPIDFSTRVTARFLPRWITLITPLREMVRLIADQITTLVVGDSVDRENILQPDELRTLLEEGQQSGVIDATEWVGPWNDGFMKFYEAAKYYYYPGMHEPGSMLAVGITLALALAIAALVATPLTAQAEIEVSAVLKNETAKLHMMLFANANAATPTPTDPSAPAGEITTLKDPGLFDGSRAQPVRLPNTAPATSES